MKKNLHAQTRLLTTPTSQRRLCHFAPQVGRVLLRFRLTALARSCAAASWTVVVLYRFTTPHQKQTTIPKHCQTSTNRIEMRVPRTAKKPIIYIFPTQVPDFTNFTSN